MISLCNIPLSRSSIITQLGTVNMRNFVKYITEKVGPRSAFNSMTSQLCKNVCQSFVKSTKKFEISENSIHFFVRSIGIFEFFYSIHFWGHPLKFGPLVRPISAFSVTLQLCKNTQQCMKIVCEINWKIWNFWELYPLFC